VNEREYRRLRQQIEDDYRRKIDALEVVWKLSANTSNGNSAEVPVKRGTIDNLVRNVLGSMTGQFSPRDVMEEMQKIPDFPGGINRSSVSSALKRLADDGVLSVVQIGKGKRASRYQRKGVSLKPSDAIDEPPLSEPEEPGLEPITDDDIPF
jgi:hypothetical protein